jgi:hypothetical protein
MRPIEPHACPCELTDSECLGPTPPDQTDWTAHRCPHDSAIFWVRSVILLKASAIFWLHSIILLLWTQPFCYSKLNHFAIVNSTIFLQCSVIFWLLQCSVIPRLVHCTIIPHYYSARWRLVILQNDSVSWTIVSKWWTPSLSPYLMNSAALYIYIYI